MLITYKNGNADITLSNNGTRVIEFENDLQLEYPLNIDIRISSSCSFADNICKDFCHESALVKGRDCDFTLLKEKLRILPKGIELAVGVNQFTDDIMSFFIWCKLKGFVVNITINQGHLLRDEEYIKSAIDVNLINGIGISYRASLKWNVPQYLLDYEHTIFNVIVGIDDVFDIKLLSNKGVKKICVLGEKKFGFNSNKQLDENKHNQWKWNIHSLFSLFEVVSFDNLGVEQLQIKRFFTNEQWDEFYQHEFSFYIDAVNKVFKLSSRSDKLTNWNEMNVLQYFKQLKK